MMDVVIPNAARKGYQPDYVITPDGTHSLGRPYPYMIYHNMEALKLSASWKVVKVGDTISDIQEGVNAGVWSVGVIIGSSEMGLSQEEFNALSDVEKETVISATQTSFIQNGADFTIRSMGELPQLIGRINVLISQGIRPYAR
jgi:phosphonoacetaldehyde hydrolase